MLLLVRDKLEEESFRSFSSPEGMEISQLRIVHRNHEKLILFSYFQHRQMNSEVKVLQRCRRKDASSLSCIKQDA